MSQPKSKSKPKPKTLKASKPSLAIVGSGRLGQALAIALGSSGYPIVAVVAEHASHARKAASLIKKRGKPPVALSGNQLNQLPAADLILICTPDDVIKSVAEAMAGSHRRPTGSRTVLHTSGALASDVLNSMGDLGFHTGSLHPLVSVSEPDAGAEALRGAFYCLEGDKEALRIARSLVSDLKGASFSIAAASKPLYHAAAVMASGHLVALFDLATEMLARCGLSQNSARQILTPLVDSTLNNLKTSNPKHALTGTFARGDVATVDRHLKALSPKELSAALAVYKLLGLRSIKLAEKNKLDPQLLEQIRKLMNSRNGD